MENTKKITLLIVAFMCTLCVAQKSEESLVICYNQQDSFNLPERNRKLSKHFYSSLNFSPFFNTKKLQAPAQMREELLTPYQGDGKIHTVTTQDGHEVECTYFDRGSDTLLVIGTGFGNEREKVAPFIHMFSKYDIVTFDYRGHGFKEPKIFDMSTQPTSFAKRVVQRVTPFINWNKLPNVDLNKTTLGEDEDKDVQAVIQFMLDQKQYKQVFGLGLCFSSYVFAKVAAQNPNLFKKLILDSSIYSIRDLIQRITDSPQLIMDPQRGQLPKIVKTTVKTSQNIVKTSKRNMIKSAFKTLGTFLKSMFYKIFIGRKGQIKTTAEYLSSLPEETSVLFFHGNQDVLTPRDHDYLNNINQTKLPNRIGVEFKEGRHLTNHIKYKEEYAAIGNLFFELPFNVFVECLKNPEKYLDYMMNQIREETL